MQFCCANRFHFRIVVVVCPPRMSDVTIQSNIASNREHRITDADMHAVIPVLHFLVTDVGISA